MAEIILPFYIYIYHCITLKRIENKRHVIQIEIFLNEIDKSKSITDLLRRIISIPGTSQTSSGTPISTRPPSLLKRIYR